MIWKGIEPTEMGIKPTWNFENWRTDVASDWVSFLRNHRWTGHVKPSGSTPILIQNIRFFRMNLIMTSRRYVAEMIPKWP